MPLGHRLVPLATLVILAAAPLAAQDDVEFTDRKPLKATIGVSVGTAGVQCVPKCSADRQSGAALMARVGGQVAQGLTIVLEADVYRREFPNEYGKGRWAMSWYMIGGLWYPNVDEDFFISLGLGLAVAHNDVEFPEVGPLPLVTTDLGGGIGFGKDFKFRNHLAVTAFAQYLLSGRSQATIGRANSGAKISTDLIHAGLALTVF